VLRVATLDRLGGAQQIVEEHLEGAMGELTADEKDVAARLFNHLVTPSGTKIAHGVSDLADFGQVTVDVLQPVLGTLSGRRILRSIEETGGVRYEIFHDVLAQPVLAWRTRHRAERELEQKLADSHRRRHRLQRLIALVLVALGLMSAVTVFALSQRSEARSKRAEAQELARKAQASALEARARAELNTDPERGLRFARQAALLAPTRSSEKTLRAALEKSRVRRVVRLDERVIGAVVRGRNLITATRGGSVVTTDRRTGAERSSAETGPAVAASFADDGTVLMTGGDHRLRLVRPDGSFTRVRGVISRRGAELSPDAKYAVVFDDVGARLIDVVSSSTLRLFERTETLAAAISKDGSLVATGHAAQTVRIWSVRTGYRIHKLFAVRHAGDIRTVAISPRGDLIASGNTDGIVQVWQTTDGVSVATLGGHTGGITDVAFSRDGERLVTASRDRTVRIWNIDASAAVAVLRGHTKRATSVAFTGTGRSVVSASKDRTARIWDARRDSELKVRGGLDELIALADRRLAATGQEPKPAKRKP
jgi:hypothetical protein